MGGIPRYINEPEEPSVVFRSSEQSTSAHITESESNIVAHYISIIRQVSRHDGFVVNSLLIVNEQNVLVLKTRCGRVQHISNMDASSPAVASL